jgi:hypothetical protein
MRRKDDAWLDGVISSDVTDVDFSLGRGKRIPRRSAARNDNNDGILGMTIMWL